MCQPCNCFMNNVSLKRMLLLAILLCFFSKIQAHDSIPTTTFRRNALKIGTNFIPNKLFLSYEYALTKHISAGVMGSLSMGYFGGQAGTLYGRYYFGKYRGWFLEVRASYAACNSYVYTSYHQNPNSSERDRIYDDKHRATITYLTAGISGGYRVICTQRLFFDFLAGVHDGKATFGENDNYLERSPIEFSFGSDRVSDVFYTTGPGNAFHFMINAGFFF